MMMPDPRLCSVPDQAAADFEIRREFSLDLQTLTSSRQAERALTAGARLPDFTLPDTDGAPVSASELLSIGPLVITFYRGVWCPYCNADLRAVEAVADSIRRTGAILVAISPQTPENNRRAQHEIGLSFPILSDRNAELAGAFGIRWMPSRALEGVYRNFGTDIGAFNGTGSWALPMPARYVAAQDGTIVHATVSPNYTHRPEPADVLPVLTFLRHERA